ncbi:hypothetical protein GCM10020254_22460 [Streptomyces goshikiensis]
MAGEPVSASGGGGERVQRPREGPPDGERGVVQVTVTVTVTRGRKGGRDGGRSGGREG